MVYHSMVFFQFRASHQVLIKVTSKMLRLKFLKPTLTETCLYASSKVTILFVSLSLYSMESSCKHEGSRACVYKKEGKIKRERMKRG